MERGHTVKVLWVKRTFGPIYTEEAVPIKIMDLTGPPIILNHDHFDETYVTKKGGMISLCVWFKSKPLPNIQWSKEGCRSEEW